MNTIIIHTPQNEKLKNFRYYNIFWEYFIDFLKTKFIVEEDTYYEFAESMQYDVKLLNEETIAKMTECEMIIENKNTKEFVVLSISDVLTATCLNHQSNPLCKKILISQFDRQHLYKHIIDEKYKSKFFPWIYFPSNIYDFDKLYKDRISIEKYIDKFCFWGTSIEDRPILNYFDKKYFIGGLPIGSFENYAKTLIQYKVALSISGRGEFCYRDIENFAIGVPIIRFEYQNEFFEPLIPNYHYISIEKPDDLIIDRMGESHHAKLIEKKFLEVKDDLDFLNFISFNAKKYYEKYLSKENSLNLTYKILQLNEWE